MNGLADNLISSCVSCHGSAQFPRSDDFDNRPSGPVDPNDSTAVAKRLAEYFKDVPPGGLFDPQTTFFQSNVIVDALPMDYSLQLQAAMERFCSAVKNKEPPVTGIAVPFVCDEEARKSALMSVTAPEDMLLRRRHLEDIDWDHYMDPIR